MERQLGQAAARIATGSLARLGVAVMTDVSIARTSDRRGVLSAVTLTDGTELLADLLVMCAGTIPDTVLAREAGLPCERGIVVNAGLASPADDNVYAIGDCAQPPEGGSGLVAQGWEQATRLVRLLTADARAGLGENLAEVPGDASNDRIDVTDVVRVKALGLEVVTMGLSGQFEHGERDLRAVRMSDPAIGRFVEVVVSQGLLVGATIVGDTECASDLSALYTRMLPVPSDPAHLIVRPLARSGAGVPLTAADMDPEHLVCQCNSVSKGSVEAAVAAGCANSDDVALATRAGTGCGQCRELVDDIVRACAGSESEAVQASGTHNVPVLAGTREG